MTKKKVVEYIFGVPKSTEAMCAAESACFSPAKKGTDKWAANLRWCDSHQLYVSKDGVVVAVTDSGFMDAVTGTLYYDDGVCHSSPYLRLGKLRRQQEQGADILLAMVPAYRGVGGEAKDNY